MGQAPEREELLTALQVVREAIDIPHPATVGDAEIRAQILYQRLLHTVVFLDNILDGHGNGERIDIAWSVGFLRDQLAKHPADGYGTWDELRADLGRPPASPACPPDVRPPMVAQQNTSRARDARSRRVNRPGRRPPGREPWTCRRCGGQVTGRRPPGGLCAGCRDVTS